MVREVLQAFHEQFPSITSVRSIGKSRWGEHLGSQISDNPKINESEPMVLLDSGHHGSGCFRLNSHLVRCIIF